MPKYTQNRLLPVLVASLLLMTSVSPRIKAEDVSGRFTAGAIAGAVLGALGLYYINHGVSALLTPQVMDNDQDPEAKIPSNLDNLVTKFDSEMCPLQPVLPGHKPVSYANESLVTEYKVDKGLPGATTGQITETLHQVPESNSRRDPAVLPSTGEPLQKNSQSVSTLKEHFLSLTRKSNEVLSDDSEGSSIRSESAITTGIVPEAQNTDTEFDKAFRNNPINSYRDGLMLMQQPAQESETYQPEQPPRQDEVKRNIPESVSTVENSSDQLPAQSGTKKGESPKTPKKPSAGKKPEPKYSQPAATKKQQFMALWNSKAEPGKVEANLPGQQTEANEVAEETQDTAGEKTNALDTDFDKAFSNNPVKSYRNGLMLMEQPVQESESYQP
ncbi:MAG: hypothetical protein ACR2PT_11205, partial [Endozoicomonas sp.]